MFKKFSPKYLISSGYILFPSLLFSVNLFNPANATDISDAGLLTQEEIKDLRISNIDLKKELNNIKIESDELPENNTKKFTSDEIKEDTIFLKTVNFFGNTVIDDNALDVYFTDLLGSDITFSQLQNAVNNIQSLYRKEGFVTTRAILPDQNFKTGNLKIAIVENFLEDIKISGGTSNIREYVSYMVNPLLPKSDKKIFKFSELERQLLLLRKVGIAQINATLSRGTEIGGSILNLNLEPKPLDKSLFTDTNLSDKLGDYQVGFRTSYTTRYKRPLRISTSGKYSFPYKDGLLSGVIYAEKPLGTKGLSLSTIYAYSQTKSIDLFPNLSGKSTNQSVSEYISLGISYPFIFQRSSELSADITTSIQNSSTDFFIDETKTNNVNTDLLRAVRLGINGRKSLKNSNNSVRFEVSQGIDGWDNSLRPDQVKSDLDAKSDFTKFNLNLTRQQFFTNGINATFMAAGQIASTPLANPEKFSYGGSTFGKGFKNSNLFGDSGWALSLKLAKDSMLKKIRVSPYIWYDYGSTSDISPGSIEESASTAGLGIGGGFKNTNFDFSLGFPTSSEQDIETGKEHAIFKFNVGLKF